MRKIFTFIALSMMSLTVMATDYTDTLVVTVDGQSVYQHATISLNEQSDGAYTLSLKNFTLDNEGSPTGVGTISLPDCEPLQTDRGLIFNEEVNITIEEGDDPSVDFWLGPMIGEVPISLRAALVGDKLQAVIDININLEFMHQIINVRFGDGYQLFNGTFESFKDSEGAAVEEDGTYAEPEYWHSFNTASGDLASLAGKAPYLSTDVRPGSTGTKSLLLKSTAVKVLGVTWAVANGTITTGRLNAGNTTATDAANHAEMDISNTAKDPSGHPFYSLLNAQPDSIVTWVKFKQQSVNSSFPYATVSATITDGTYYQEPVDKTYTNIVGRAENNTISSNGAVWQRLSIPFNYDTYTSNNAQTKAIMVTMSTNNGAGTGNEGDELYVDDVELVYNADITSVTLNGTDIVAKPYEGEEEIPEYAKLYIAEAETSEPVTAESFVVKTNAKQPFVGVEIIDAADLEMDDPAMPAGADKVAMISCYAADLSKASGWMVFIKEAGINYDLNGDGKISTADIQVIINEMKKAQADQNMKYDLNGDGKISTADIQTIINEMKK